MIFMDAVDELISAEDLVRLDALMLIVVSFWLKPEQDFNADCDGHDI